MKELTKRLLAIASLVTKNAVVADIGTDHAYIPVYLVNSGISPFAFASDIKNGPLLFAKKNIEEQGLEDKIKLCLADGLRGIKDFEADTAVIAGMGGELISKIISDYMPKGIDTLILQPMTHAEDVRETLFKIGFEREKEVLLREGSKLYVVIKAKKTEKPAPLTKEERYFPSLLALNPSYKEFLTRENRRAKRAVLGIESGEKNKENLEHLLWVLNYTGEKFEK